jgi:hypothetical protein
MAKTQIGIAERPIPTKKRTSIGSSPLSRPKSKHTKRNFKKYRGQGK